MEQKTEISGQVNISSYYIQVGKKGIHIYVPIFLQISIYIYTYIYIYVCAVWYGLCVMWSVSRVVGCCLFGERRVVCVLGGVC